MTCEKAAQIHLYFDGELDPQRAGALEAHLAGCAECRALLEELGELSKRIAGSSRAGLRLPAMARFYDAWNVARDRTVLRVTSWLTAAAAVLLIGAILTWPHNEPAKAPSARAGNWERFAVMPPAEGQGESGGTELVEVAQWMANDLSLGSGGERR